MKKILNFNTIKKKLFNFRKKRKKIVLCHGVFDLLHLGHINHLEQAKSLGDVIVVSLTPDRYVNKGPGKPVFNERDRAKVVSSLNIVDFVLINNSPTAKNPILAIKPQIYCKGSDYKNHNKDVTGEIKNEIKAIKKINGKIAYTSGQTFSSSSLLNKFLVGISEKQKKLLSSINKKYNFEKIKIAINNFGKLNVLVIGEAIIDEYVFCDALGKSGKEPVLALKEIKSERYLGGTLAVAQNISEFCNKTNILTVVGEKKEYLNEIKLKLNKNIKMHLINKNKSPTIVKKRFIDYISYNKVLGVYSINDEPLALKDEMKFQKFLKTNLSKFDLVVVSDYGHGLISKKSSQLICKKSKFLAVNAQINSSNIGYHSVRNYQNLDCLVINEKEIRHELRDRSSDLKMLTKKLASRQNINNLIVTSGKNGATFYDSNKNIFLESEGLATKILDKIGAGDTMLALIALCLKSRLDKSLSLLIGSLGAAHSTETIANKEPITKIKILKSIEHILK
jgi:rfaE bifunctional protein kinase chain/domain/rfaE bifunctional protein nucleotidyltransferase chain/domain